MLSVSKDRSGTGSLLSLLWGTDRFVMEGEFFLDTMVVRGGIRRDSHAASG